MSERAWLRALHTEPGRYTMPQDELSAVLRAKLEPLPNSADLVRMIGFVYERSGIEKRHLELPLHAISARRDWYLAINEATVSLGGRCLEGVASELPGCDAFITVSASFAGFPSLSRRLQEAAGIPLDALCYDLAGLGCAGPTQGMHLAHTLIASGSAQRVAVLCVDAMGTHSQARRYREVPDLSEVVAHCLASDGAAVVVLGREPGANPHFSYRNTSLDTRLWPDALAENDLTACAHNQPFMRVGKQIRTRLVDETSGFFGEQVLAEPLFLHPGGRALMTMLEEALPSLGPTIEVSSSILREHGNIGSASVLWVLERGLAAHMPVEPDLRLFALGPGIVTTMLHLHGVEAA